MPPTHKSESGFTLIELLIVIAIIGILAGIAIPQFNQYKIRGYDAHSKQALHDMHLLCNAYWLDTDALQGCDLPKIKEVTYGFNQSPDVEATLPPSPLDNFCASAKHNSSPNTYSIDSAAAIFPTSNCTEYVKPDECLDLYMHDQEKDFVIEINSLGGGQGASWLNKKGLSWLLMNANSPWIWWRQCRGLHLRGAPSKFIEKWNERQPSHNAPVEVFYSPEDLESARHFGPRLRNLVSDGCIEQQTKCLAPYGLGDPRNRSSFEGKGCPELLTASCSIKPTGILNTPGERCVSGDLDCGDIFDITPRCSEDETIRLPGCKGFVDRESFEQKCRSSLRGRDDWREIACTLAKYSKNTYCCKYSKGDPETMKYFN